MVIGQTSRTVPFIVASHETLFRKVSNICCEDRENMKNEPIRTNHIYPIIPSLLQWLQKQAHAVMEDLIACELPLRLRKTFQLGDRNVTNEDCGSFGWLVSY